MATSDDDHDDDLSQAVRESQRRVQAAYSSAVSALSEGDIPRARSLLARCSELIKESGDLLRTDATGRGLRRTGSIFKSLLDRLGNDVSELARSLPDDDTTSTHTEKPSDAASTSEVKRKRKATAGARAGRRKKDANETKPKFRLSANERKAITDFMENQRGALSLHDIAEERKRECSELITERLPGEYPGRSVEEYTAQALIGWLSWFLVERGIARRLTFDDPAELATCAILEGRFEWMTSYDVREDNCYPRIWAVLRALGARDFVVAKKFTETLRFPIRKGHRDIVPLYNSLFAVLKHDWKYLRSLVPTLRERKPALWIGAMYPCLIGVAEGSPSLVAEGLNEMYRTCRRRDAHALEKTIYLEMHGMYELCRWVSPELVSEFDVNQPFPWDKAYCEFLRRCDEPAMNIHLETVSPVLHNWVTTLSTPYWWRPVDPEAGAEFQRQWNQIIEGLGGCLQKAFRDSPAKE
jgi:hypothetical protein